MNKIKLKKTYLLPKNNFWIGLGSLLNIRGSYFDYKYSKSDHEADAEALSSDWQNVGEDIKKSIKIINKQLK